MLRQSYNPLYMHSRLNYARRRRETDQVLFLSDPFHRIYAAAVLDWRRLQGADKMAACQVTHLPVIGAGRTLILERVLERRPKNRRHRVMQALAYADPQAGCPWWGSEADPQHPAPWTVPACGAGLPGCAGAGKTCAGRWRAFRDAQELPAGRGSSTWWRI